MSVSKNWSWWRDRLIFVVIVIVIYRLINDGQAISQFLSVIMPFLMGVGLAYLLSRPCQRLENVYSKINLKGARGLSILSVYLIVIAIVSMVLSYIIPIVTANLLDLSAHLPDQFLDQILETLENLNEFNLDDLAANFMNMFSMEGIITALSSVGNYVMVMTSTVINVFLSLIISIYTLLYKNQILETISRIAALCIKQKRLQTIKSYIHKSDEIFYQFVSCQFLDACILGTLATILLAILGVQYAVTLGLILGACNMIPYFGSIFASILTAIITFFTGGAQLAIITIICLLILQQIDGNIIGPKLMGGALNINPMVVILSITIGGAYFGIIGMFLAVPIAGILKMLVEDMIISAERK